MDWFQQLQASWIWIVFGALVLAIWLIDIGGTGDKKHPPSKMRSILVFFLILLLVTGFAGMLAWQKGSESALLFVTGFIVEEALSIDNLFVFWLIFRTFKVPLAYQQRVLFWGILGAMGMRGLFIGLGSALVSQFSWLFYFFGALLIHAAINLLRNKSDEHQDLEHHPILTLANKWLPITDQMHEDRFSVRLQGKWFLTPLFVVLLIVEFSDLVFAIDSIPAIFAITTDPLLIYTSNIFAILGLRSLYFLLGDLLPKFRYLQPALALILLFIGCKMLLHNILHIPVLISLALILLSLILAVLFSILYPHNPEPEETLPLSDPTNSESTPK